MKIKTLILGLALASPLAQAQEDVYWGCYNNVQGVVEARVDDGKATLKITNKWYDAEYKRIGFNDVWKMEGHIFNVDINKYGQLIRDSDAKVIFNGWC